ncbi:hypothetical protein MKW94_008708 [Papaver nudicaule]|uniref:Cytosolic iron-sulfur protein assembly protein CIAO1 homolog n=1 Tax=Papaver nudicaule TaxID=74823 RepID=A0AA41SIV0_PAPNU|nr:hypothetical protein [Papaver nudicaule]
MVQWHPFLDMLVICSYDNTVKIWAEEDDDSDNWHCVRTLNESSNGHSSTNGHLYLTLKIWESDPNATPPADDGFAPWRHASNLAGYHDRTIFSVHWSREGIIASGAADDAIRLFVKNEEVDGASYRLLLKKEKAHEMDVNAVQWSSHETKLDRAF